VVWFHNIIVRAIDVVMVMTTAIQSATLCHFTWTTRMRNRPMDNFARAFPVMAKLLAT
jgi:hypothetical protein